MSANATSLSLVEDPIAVELLSSTHPAQLAYNWFDGSPRVSPVWFHWDGTAIFVGTPANAPKVQALQANPQVAVTIDSASFPYHVLSLRGVAEVEVLDDVCAEYAAAADRYLGPEQGPAWVATRRGRPMARIRVLPEWVNIIDFDTRLPSALSA